MAEIQIKTLRYKDLPPAKLTSGDVESLSRYAGDAALGLPDFDMLEIGSWCGASTILIARELKRFGWHGNLLYSIDPHISGARRRTFKKYIEDCGGEDFSPLLHVKDIIKPLRKKSCDVIWEKQISFLFIDGDHNEIKVDFEKFSPFVVTGGFVLVHDFGNSNHQAIKKYFETRKDGFPPTGFEVAAKVGLMLILKRTGDDGR